MYETQEQKPHTGEYLVAFRMGAVCLGAAVE